MKLIDFLVLIVIVLAVGFIGYLLTLTVPEWVAISFCGLDVFVFFMSLRTAVSSSVVIPQMYAIRRTLHFGVVSSLIICICFILIPRVDDSVHIDGIYLYIVLILIVAYVIIKCALFGQGIETQNKINNDNVSLIAEGTEKKRSVLLLLDEIKSELEAARIEDVQQKKNAIRAVSSLADAIFALSPASLVDSANSQVLETLQADLYRYKNCVKTDEISELLLSMSNQYKMFKQL